MVSLKLFHLAICGSLFNHVASTKPLVRNEKTDVIYQGTTRDGVEHFQNIKFARDTSGPRRFAPPEPYLAPRGHVVDATLPGPACPQVRAAMLPFFDETKEMSEDCLNLRIARPVGTKAGDKLPVVVWIHGGGVVKGSAYDSHTEPDRLIQYSIAIEKPVIFVAINYRLSIFGFARLPVLKDEKSLNVGVRDQRVGFQWVKDNIEAFGGDTERITAYGLSAGATFTSLHLTSFGGSKGVPFTQAWLMSGPPGTALNMTSDATTLHTLAVAEKLECMTDDAKNTLECLRNVPMSRLLSTALEHSVANHPPSGLFTFIPSIDDDVFIDRQSSLYRQGSFAKGIPLVLSWTQDDGALNAGPAPAFKTENDIVVPIKGFAHALTPEDISNLLSLYDPADFNEDVKNYDARKGLADPEVSVHYFRASQVIRDLLFTCSSIDFGFYMTKFSKAQNPLFPGVRLYTLNQSMLTPLWIGAGMPYVGVSHGSDTNYIFAGLFPEGEVSAEDTELANHMTNAFIRFAYTGSPDTAMEDQEDWPEICGTTIGTNLSECTAREIQVVGGPFGNGPATLSRHSPVLVKTDDYDAVFDTNEQKVLDGAIRTGGMRSASFYQRNREMQRQKLVERCDFINSLSEKLGV